MERKCPKCRENNDTADYVGKGNYSPKENDISICFYCATVSKFNKNLKLVELSETELRSLMIEDPKTYDSILKVQATIKKIRKL